MITTGKVFYKNFLLILGFTKHPRMTQSFLPKQVGGELDQSPCPLFSMQVSFWLPTRENPSVHLKVHVLPILLSAVQVTTPLTGLVCAG